MSTNLPLHRRTVSSVALSRSGNPTKTVSQPAFYTLRTTSPGLTPDAAQTGSQTIANRMVKLVAMLESINMGGWVDWGPVLVFLASGSARAKASAKSAARLKSGQREQCLCASAG